MADFQRTGNMDQTSKAVWVNNTSALSAMLIRSYYTVTGVQSLAIALITVSCVNCFA